MTLYKRLTETGTLSEADGVPKSQFALPATVNWMRALAMLVDEQGIDAPATRNFYSKVSRRKTKIEEENTIFEQLFFALHQCSALHALRTLPSKADVARVGIVTWYYGVYAAASAMITAQAGSFHDTHQKTADVWDHQIAARGLIMSPFDARIPSLVKKDAEQELANLLIVPKFNLTSSLPNTTKEARGACHAYLSGNAKWWREKTQEDVRKFPDFRRLNVSDFRTNAAKQILNNSLSRRSMGFLHQAFRYRGKANYREALYLGYGKSTETKLTGYIDDLSKVLDALGKLCGTNSGMMLSRIVHFPFRQRCYGGNIQIRNYSHQQAFALTLTPASTSRNPATRSLSPHS